MSPGEEEVGLSLRKLGYFFLKIYFIVYYVYMYEHMCAGAQWGQKKVLNSIELKLHAVVGCPVHVLGTELQSSERAAKCS